jgi:hypothetical protein
MPLAVVAKSEWFRDLLTEDLSGVVFVRDYVQLQFNPNPTLNIYTPIAVAKGGTTHRSGDDQFANALIGQINKWVADVRVNDQDIAIHFRDDSVVSFSTRPDDVGPYEAFTFFTRNGEVYEE